LIRFVSKKFVDIKKTIINKINVEKNQNRLTKKIVDISKPYTPFRFGRLTRTVKTQGNVITYNTPYVRYLWYGYVMVGPAPKQVTNRLLKFRGAPKRGRFWIVRAYKDNLKFFRDYFLEYVTNSK